MSLKVTHKYSTAAGTPPASGDIDVGELAINAADAELYTKDNAGNIRKFQNTTTGTADGVQFTQAGTGAVQRTVESKLKDVVSVKDFGAVGDGVTDDTAAIQDAIDSVSTNGQGLLYVPPGTYLLNPIHLKSNVRLCGASAAKSVLKFASSITSLVLIAVAGQNNVQVENLTIDMNNAAGPSTSGPVGIQMQSSGANGCNSVAIKSCVFKNSKIRPYIDFTTSVTCRGFTVDSCHFIGHANLIPVPPPNFQTAQGIRALPAASGCGDWRFTNNRFELLGNVLQIRPGSEPWDYDRVDSVVVSGNVATNFPDDPNISTSPYELFCITGLTVTGNTIYSGGRGYNGSLIRNGTYAGNTAYDQTLYFFEMQACDGVSIVGNSAYNCKSFVAETGYGGSGGGSKNILIASNTITGGSDGEPGFSNYQTYSPVINVNSNEAHENWKISDNTIINPKYTNVAINFAYPVNKAVVSNNFILSGDSTSLPNSISLRGTELVITDNYVEYSGTLTDAVANNNYLNSLLAGYVPNATTGCLIKNNTVKLSGTDGRTPPNNTGFIGIGPFAGSHTASGVIVEGNRLIGSFNNIFFLQATNGDTVVQNNDTTRATGNQTINAATVFRRTKRVAEGTTAPTTGTWALGDIAWNTNPTFGGPVGWICRAAGTPGTWEVFATTAQQTSITAIGDVDTTLSPLSSRGYCEYSTTLTADRTITLSTTGAWGGCKFSIVRTAGGAFNLNVGGLKTLAQNQWCEVVYRGDIWRLTKFGSL